jgi:hypothetical protein
MFAEFTATTQTQVAVAIAQIARIEPSGHDSITTIYLSNGDAVSVKCAYDDVIAATKRSALDFALDLGFASTRAHRELMEAM